MSQNLVFFGGLVMQMMQSFWRAGDANDASIWRWRCVVDMRVEGVLKVNLTK